MVKSIVIALMVTVSNPTSARHLDTATFAGGCFWCIESSFLDIEGVTDVKSGYAGGTKKNPTYEEVCTGTTGHREAVQVTYDPEKISYEKLLHTFWRQIDPTDDGGQFADRGSQYRTAIFYHNKEQKRLAEKSKDELAASGIFDKSLVTEIVPFSNFYKAEDYHQKYCKLNPLRYKLYRKGSGRDDFLNKVWKDEKTETPKASQTDPKKTLTPLQYHVTQECGTEPAFRNEFWDNHREGIYVDIVSGEPLFSSLDKFDSGSGWPSFTKPLEPSNIVEKEDRSLFAERTEVKSRHGNSHLGHVFDDGPNPTGLRYCINSASLRFIPKEDLQKEGYGKYSVLFDKKKK